MKTIYVGPSGELHPDFEDGGKDTPFDIDFLASREDIGLAEIILLPGKYHFDGNVNVYSSIGPLTIKALNRWESFIQSPDDNNELLIDADGANVHFEGIVFEDVKIEDRTIEPNDRDTDIPGAVFFRGPRQRLDNCIIRNLKLGVGFWSTATEFVGKGNIIYNIGWYDETSVRKEGTHGHAAYGQTDGEHVSRFEGNVIFAGLNHGLHAYSQSEHKLDNLEIIDNIMFGTQHRACLVGGTKAFKNLSFEGNTVYDAGCQLGYNVHAKGENVLVRGNQFLECTPDFVNLKDVSMIFNDFVPKSTTAFNTLMPDEAQRYKLDNWNFASNHLYTKAREIRIGRQAQNLGTKYEGYGTPIFDDAFSHINGAEDFSIFRYIQAGPGLVYFMYYHSKPKEETRFKFNDALGKCKVSNVLDPTFLISEELDIDEPGDYIIPNDPTDPKFLGGDISDLLPDPQLFGVLIFQQIERSTEPGEPQEPGDSEPSKDDLKEMADAMAAIAKSMGVSIKQIAENITVLGENLAEMAEMCETAGNFFQSRFKADGTDQSEQADNT